MNKLVAILVIIIISLSAVCGVLLYQISELQNHNNDLQNQISQLETEMDELENQLEHFQRIAPAGFDVYSNFGFSFFYPEDSFIHEEGFMGKDDADGDSGSVLVLPNNGGFEAMFVHWTKSEPVDLVQVSNEMLSDLHVVQIRIIEPLDGQFSSTNGHTMYYQICSTTGFMGLQIILTGYSVYGVWYCSDTETLYGLMVNHSEAPFAAQSTLEGAISDFNQYIDSFRCH